MTRKITVAHGDGIGPEIMGATLKIFEAAKVELEYETIEVGKALYEAGFSSGIKPEAWDSIANTKVLFKAPITTPQGGGMKSLNVTLRKTLGLFANVRPCRSYHPIIPCPFPDMDVLVVRENEEDVYGGIEHQQSGDITQCLKIISRPGSERIIKYAFMLARNLNRKKVTCLIKDNIMKRTDGLFAEIFESVSKDYPEIKAEKIIVDIGMARFATRPHDFDVIVLPNLYGDILSDIAAELTGSVGLAPSSNIGTEAAMFEAVHGSAPDIAGKGVANPSGLLLSGCLMLDYLGMGDKASLIHNAWLKTIEDGVHTGDLFKEGVSQKKVGTGDFTQAVISNLGNTPVKFKPVVYGKKPAEIPEVSPLNDHSYKLVGVDLFVRNGRKSLDEVVSKGKAITPSGLTLKVVTNRGTKVWPDGNPATFCVDQYVCRYIANDESSVEKEIVNLISAASREGVQICKTEYLYSIDGKDAFSKAQGE